MQTVEKEIFSVLLQRYIETQANMHSTPYSINCRGKILELKSAQVMGILNVTPDSFYADSRTMTDEAIARRCRQIIEEGGSIIDIGGYSSRPGADDVPEEEETERLRRGIAIARREAPDAILSVDTFRAGVARRCIEDFGADIINDISGGNMDPRMPRTVAQLGVPYILMHMQGTPQDMQAQPTYTDIATDVFQFFARRLQQLRDLGAKDIILDPGFGFGKTLSHNYELMAHLEEFQEFGLPILVGVSRKSMIYKLLGQTPETALNGTTALHAIALLKGASILRVHDVKAAVEVVRIHEALQAAGSPSDNASGTPAS